jgi:hypothetical protein
MEASVVAAWWGAIVASIVLLWDIFKWLTKGARVLIHAKPNMQTLNQLEGKLNDDKNILVEVINIGDLPTTITHLVFYEYKSFLEKILNKPITQGVIPYQGRGMQELPYLLGPGARWVGMISQADLEEKTQNDSVFYCGVIHTLRKKPVRARVILHEKST